MIYKLRFEVYTDDNVLLHARSEESGNFLWVLTEFMLYVMGYAKHNKLHKDE